MRGTFIVLALTLSTASAWAQTTIPAGNLVGSQSWTAAGSPYLLSGDVTVPAGITLTIEAGAEVRLGPGDSLGSGLDTLRTELRVLGTLAVAGTGASPATITSGAVAPATGDYYGVVLLAGATVNITSAQVNFGQRCIYAQATGAVISDLRTTRCVVGIEVAGGSTSLTASSLTQGTTYGVYATAGALTASGLTVAQNASYGVYCSNASCAVSQSVIRNNAGRGVYFRSDSGTLTQSLSKSTVFSNGSYGIYVSFLEFAKIITNHLRQS